MPYKERLRTGLLSLGKRWLTEDVIHVQKYLREVQERGWALFPVLPCDRRLFHWNKPFLTVVVINVLELAVQWRCGLSILRRYSKPNWTQPWVTCCSWPCCEQGRWIRWSPMAPANLNYSLILSSPEILSRPSPPMILMSQTVRKYKKKRQKKNHYPVTLPSVHTATLDNCLYWPSD